MGEQGQHRGAQGAVSSPPPVQVLGVPADPEVGVGDGAHDAFIGVTGQATLTGTLVVDPIDVLQGARTQCRVGDEPQPCPAQGTGQHLPLGSTRGTRVPWEHIGPG